MIFETRDQSETFKIGFEEGEKAAGGSVYALYGDLGAGKTVFAQGFAAGLGIKDIVCSPTFTLVHEYEDGRMPLYHFDAYRIAGADEMEETGFDERIAQKGAVLIEWAERLKEILPRERVDVVIEKDPAKDPDYRKITIDRYK